MRILRRLLPYARPLHHFIPEYVIYTVFGILFGLVNFALLVPILDLLFNQSSSGPVMAKPEFSFSIDYLKNLFYYHFNSTIAEHGKFNALLFVCAIAGSCILLSNIFRYLAVKVLIRLRLRMMYGVRNDLFNKYMHQSLRFHHDQPKGESMMIMTSEVQEIEGSVINSLQVWLRDPLYVIAYFGVLMYWSAQLTLFTLIFLPVTGLLITSITRKLKKLSYFSQDMMSIMVSLVNECMHGIRQVQSFTAEKLMLKRFEDTNRRFSQNSKQLFSKKELASPVSEVLGVFAALILILFGGYLILNGNSDLTGQSFISYLILYTQIMQPLKNISQTSSNIQRGIAATERIFKVLDAETEIKDTPGATEKTSFQRGISVSDISFAYEQKQVIKNISLEIPEGKKIALVGASGSGKSTLVDLICRYYDVQQGSISIDGTDIRNIKLSSLRHLISFVSQNTFLFNDTIANNIALGMPGAKLEDIMQAARIANAHDFIVHTENGYDTIIGEGGLKLSGGQRQRITIARAILKNAPILILDEATSALDTESERLVQDAINKMMENRTSIVIAHRLSTVRHTDEIIVMQHGEIAERGSHDDLIARGGIYKKLVDLQEVK
ncbi:MAG TPA: ABC transporter ATP-binding protein [Chitinophagaceae bacterium]